MKWGLTNQTRALTHVAIIILYWISKDCTCTSILPKKALFSFTLLYIFVCKFYTSLIKKTELFRAMAYFDIFQILSAVCSIQRSRCRRPRCSVPIKPMGHCCEICGMYNQVTTFVLYCRCSDQTAYVAKNVYFLIVESGLCSYICENTGFLNQSDTKVSHGKKLGKMLDKNLCLQKKRIYYFLTLTL